MCQSWRCADADARAQITARHLLTHRSGFYGDRFDDQGNGDDALEKAVRSFGDLPQVTEVDELYTYCNAGIDLVGRAIENLLGQTFESAMRERVLDRLGLERTTYFASEAIRHSVAVGHQVGGEDGQTVADPWPIPRRSSAAGGVTSNVAELIRFAVMHLRDGAIGEHRVISEASAQEMRTPQAEADYEHKRGLAWVVRTAGDLTLVEHGGATNGFMARLILIPEKQYAIVVLTNGEFGSTLHNAVMKQAIERRFGVAWPSPERVALSSDQLRRFAGTFVHQLGDTTITVENDGLRMSRIARNAFTGEGRDLGTARISPVEELVFVVEDGPLVGSIGELLTANDGTIRFLRFNGRLLQPQE